MHRLEKKILEAKNSGRVALVPFLTACYPDRESFWQALADLDAGGADIIEIGVPFSDPVADGPVVESASRHVLESGVNLAEILAGIKKIGKKLNAELVLMGYLNPFLQYGFAKFAEDAAECGVAGVIIPDLPHDEAAPFKEILARHDMALIPLVAQNTSNERMALYAADARGYVYVVSVMGTTGARNSLADTVAETIDRARKIFNVPVALGFGLKTPDQLTALPPASRPDAAVFGSALLQHLASGRSARSFMEVWR